MPTAYSADLRRRVIEEVETGASRREAAEHFAIDPSSAVRGLQCWNETGRCAPKPRGGSTSPLEQHSENVKSHPTATPFRVQFRPPGSVSIGSESGSRIGVQKGFAFAESSKP